MSNTYYFSGTVGDAFVAMCKLSTLGRPYTLRRLCRHPVGDSTIERLSRMFAGCRYVTPYIHFDTIEEMRTYAFRHAGHYVNIYFDGDGRGGEPDDPPGVRFDPHPTYVRSAQTEPAVVDDRHVVVHLHAGARPDSPRAFDTGWVRELCDSLRPASYQIVLTGTGECYTEAELRRLPQSSRQVINLVGRDTFEQWIDLLSSADLAVLPEGLPAFMTLSQGVPAIVFYQDESAVQRMPYEWRRLATFVRIDDAIESRWAPLAVRSLSEGIKAVVAPYELGPGWTD